MKTKELQELIKVSYHQVGLYGRDAARIYHAVVALDSEVLKLRKLEAAVVVWRKEVQRQPAVPLEYEVPLVDAIDGLNDTE